MPRGGVWLLPAAALVAGLAHYVFWNSETGRAIQRERRAASIERMRGRVPDAMIARAENAPLGYEVTARSTALARAVGIVTSALLWAAAAHLVCSVLLLRGDIGFAPVLAVFSRGALVWMSAELFLVMLMALTGESRGAPSLPELLPQFEWPAQTTFAGSLVARIDVFDAGWVPIVALGLAALYGFPAWKVAAAVAGAKIVLLVTLAIAFRLPDTGGGTPFLRHAP